MTNTYETVREYAFRLNTTARTIYAFLKENNINVPVISGLKMIGEFEAKSIAFALSKRRKKSFIWASYNKKMNINQD